MKFGGLDSPTPSANLSDMQYFIHFVQEDSPYFVFPSEWNGVGLQQLAQDIIMNYFVEGSDEPQPIPPDPRIPNEIRILDEAGNTLTARADSSQRSRDKVAPSAARRRAQHIEINLIPTGGPPRDDTISG